MNLLPFFLPRVDNANEEDCCEYHVSNLDTSLDHARLHHDFSLHQLAWALQNHADVKAVARYLKSFEPSRIKDDLRQFVGIAPGGPFFPILYFVVERNSPGMVRLLCASGAQPSQTMRPLGLPFAKLPLLAYAVISAEYNLVDTTDTFIALLAMGAEPADIPRDMWQEYVKAPVKSDPKNSEMGASSHSWCSPELREALCRTLNLMQRYALWNADGIARPALVMRKIAEEFQISPLLETHYHIVGQRKAVGEVINRVTDHIMHSDNTPLVLLFTGPSGHGKTELAQRMGNLLSLDMLTVDCTEMKEETDMFGAKSPWLGYEKGSPLNNFLWDHAGERCVIFLDEIEKTTKDVRNAMLKVLEHGFYRERRLTKLIDCSKVIWIMASNHGSEIIQKFWAEKLKDLPQEQQPERLFTSFEESLKHSIISEFGAPFTGRLSAIIPFMPFTLGEQAVTTYKFMRSLWTEVRKPINTAARKFPRHVFLNYNGDGSIAVSIAKSSYSVEMGARPLERAVIREVRGRLSRDFLARDEMVSDDMNGKPLQNYEVRLITDEDDIDKVAVEHRGTRQIQMQPGTEGSYH